MTGFPFGSAIVLPYLITLSALTSTFGGNCDADLVSGFQIDHQLKFHRLLELGSALALPGLI